MIRGRAGGVGWLGRPCYPAPAEVCCRLGLQAAEGALEGALPLSRAGAVRTDGHHQVIYGDAALLTANHGFYNELKNSRNKKR